GKLTDFFRDVLENFKNPLAIIDFNENFKLCNQKFQEIVNKSSKEILNGKFSDVFPEQLAEKFVSFVESELTDLTFETKFFNEKQNVENKYKVYFCKQDSKFNAEKVILITLELKNDEKIYEDEIEFILTKRGKMFDILIQKNPEPVFIYDKENLKFLEVNEAAVNLYGYTRDEFLQMDLTDLYSPEDIQTLLDSSGDETSAASYSKPFRHRKKDGTIILVKISKTPFMFNDREAHFNIVNDITDSVEIDKQNQMLRAIFAQSDLMVLTTDAAGFITYVNQNSVEIFGYSAEELLRSSFASLVIDDERALINTSIFQYHIKDAIELETTIKSADGSVIECYLSAYPVMDFEEEIDAFTLILKPKVIPSESKEIVKEVVKEIVVEKSAEEDKRTVILDSNFLSGMFHEILTPINVIIGFSQELISSTENPTEEQKEAAEIINQNRIKMMDTMNSVVEYSDILQNKTPLKIEDINITEIIEKLDENIQNISGINDIQFLYGKISSSLKFKSDLHKFESFVLTVIKVVSRLSKDKKVYFSAFPVDNESFLIGLSDQYGNPSEYVANVLEQVYENSRDPKDFGLPKLTTYLSRVLLDYLGGRFYRSSTQTLRPETGFIFNLTLSSKSRLETVRTQPEVSTEKSVAADQIKISEEIEKSEEVDLAAEPEIPEKDQDIFKPVPPMSQEILSKLSEDVPEEDLADEKAEDHFEQDESLDVKTEITDKSDQLPEQESLIPQQEVKEEVTETVPVKSLDLSKLNCLYIEDQIDSQLLFKVQLKELRDVKFAVSFEEAQLLLFSHQFDFIVMDINLQGEYNGLDALKIIKAMPAFSSIPIIAVTAYVLPGDKEKFIAAGFDDFISKPIFREKMIVSLEKIFLSK
ncbi:MAG: PAS domain S-box protein, partial [Ignavibacteriaceae bacterium]|nr:PAS domain S-box protein [Ignavibacteriaceae bacterium]